jgi:predicted transcriptional regulator
MDAKPRATRAAGDRQAARRVRVMNWLKAGFSYEEIALHEGITRDWVRRIVKRAVKLREEDRPPDPRLMAELRLEPALRLAAKAIIENKLEGIDRLVKVIDRMQRYGRPHQKPVYDENARAKLMAKLNRNLGHLVRREEAEPENSPAVVATP